MSFTIYSTSWCGPCKRLKRQLAELNITFQEIDIEQDEAVAIRYGIRGVPTMVLLDAAGNELKRKVGTMNEQELLEFAA